MKTLLLFLFLVSANAQARIFNMGKEMFGSILRSTYAPAVPGNLAWSTSGGNNVTTAERYVYTPSYEFGVVFATSKVSTRLTFEIIQPTEMKGILGNDAAGTQMYSLTNSFSVFMPKLGIEFNMWQGAESRVIFGLEAGSGSVTLQNGYTMTATGAGTFGFNELREELKGTALAYGAALGFEMLLSDTTTIFLDAGYRMLSFTAMTHNVAAANSFQGAVAKGDPALANDGTARTFSLTGLYAGLALRFWIF